MAKVALVLVMGPSTSFFFIPFLAQNLRGLALKITIFFRNRKNKSGFFYSPFRVSLFFSLMNNRVIDQGIHLGKNKSKYNHLKMRNA